MGEHRIISCDGHLETPFTGWFDRIPHKYRDLAPRLVRLPEGGEAWLIEGQPLIHNGSNLAAGGALTLRNASYWRSDGTPAVGTGGPEQRIREQDEDGIDAEVLFPPVFLSQLIKGISDANAYKAFIRAYNEFVLLDYCSYCPDRLYAPALVPACDLQSAMEELEFASASGFKAVCLFQFPNGTDTPHSEDDAFYRLALELRMPLTVHSTIGSPTSPLFTRAMTGSFDLAHALMRGTMPHPIRMIAQLIASGVLDRIPELRLYIAETNVGWIPAVLERMDDAHRLFGKALQSNLADSPSEYVRRHFVFGFVRDLQVTNCLGVLRPENLMWGSDFPHLVTSFPESRSWLDRMFRDLDERVRQKILHENPTQFFGLDSEPHRRFGTPAAVECRAPGTRA
jgi:predicted TIM-barrel fold metal-dependent hydrolase